MSNPFTGSLFFNLPKILEPVIYFLAPFYEKGYYFFRYFFLSDNVFLIALAWFIPIFILDGIGQYAKKRSTQGMPQGTRKEAQKSYNESRPRKENDKREKSIPFNLLVKADGAWGKLLLNRQLWNLLRVGMSILIAVFILTALAWFFTYLLVAYHHTGSWSNKYSQAFLTLDLLIGLGAGIILPFAIIRLLVMDFFLRKHLQNIDSYWNEHLIRNRKRSSLRKGEFTDVRELNLKTIKYNPLDYFEEAYYKNSIFLGLEKTDNNELKPILIDKNLWNKSNIQIVGKMGSGKGIQASNALYQCLKYFDDAVIVFDPKNDEFAPHVLKSAGKAFKIIDLSSETPQFNLFSDMSTNELIEILESGFNLGSDGSESDYYRNFDRSAVRALAEQFPNGTNVQKLLQGIDNIPKDLAEKATNFIFMLRELCRIPVLQTDIGGDIEEIINHGGCLYFIGHIRKDDVKRLQKMIATRCIQLIEKRDRSQNLRHVNIFLDEFKHMVSKELLDSMGTLRDKRGNFLIAHQSLGDLHQRVTGMDARAVKDTVVDNTPLKWIYRASDADSAKWASDQTGEIIAENARTRIDSSDGGAELAGAVQEITEARRNLIDTTTVQHLPEGCGVVIGLDIAKIGFNSTIRVVKDDIYFTPRPRLEIVNKYSELIEEKAQVQPTNSAAAPQVPNSLAALTDSAVDGAEIFNQKEIDNQRNSSVKDRNVRIDF